MRELSGCDEKRDSQSLKDGMVFLEFKNVAAGPILKIAVSAVKKRKGRYRLGISRI
jgi:hypothetical protein